MGFKGQRNEGSGIDYDALNDYTIDTCGLQEKETLIGYISMIVDTGTQKIEDGKMPFSGSLEDEEKLLEEEKKKFPNSTTKFKDLPNYQNGGKIERYKCWENKPAATVAIAVDFPSILLDKGQFFKKEGEEYTPNPLPLRLWLGGTFGIKGLGQIISSPTTLKENKKDFNVWSLPKNNTLHKMAVASKLVTVDQPFGCDRVEELLGKSMQFETRVFRNSRGYYTEYIKYAAALSRDQSPPEIISDIGLIFFDEPSDEKAWLGVSKKVKNTMTQAVNYEGSHAQLFIEKDTVTDTTTQNNDVEEDCPY